MKNRLRTVIFLCLAAFWGVVAARAQTPSVAQLGLDKTPAAGVLYARDKANAWVALGKLDSATHSFLATPKSVTTPFNHNFFNTGNIDRFGGRVFVGGAVVNDGLYWDGAGDAPPGSCSSPPNGCVNAATQLDWSSQIQFQNYNGFVGVYQGGDCNWATLCVLTDPNIPTARQAGASVAILAVNQSLGKPSDTANNPTPRAAEFVQFANAAGSLGAKPAANWADYLECHLLTVNNTACYGTETDLTCFVVCATNWTPYSNSGAYVVGHDVACGAGLSGTGQYNCTVAYQVGSNPMAFAVGHMIAPNAICACGVGGTKPGFQMPWDVSAQWFLADGSLGMYLRASSGGDALIATPGSGKGLIVLGAISTGPGTTGGIVGDGEVAMKCRTAANGYPGTGWGKLTFVPGTNPNTLKLVASAGSGAGGSVVVTIMDNIPATGGVSCT